MDGKAQQQAFDDISTRWKGLEAWGLRERKDVAAPGTNGAGDNPPWNLHFPPVLDRIKRWDALRDMWIHNPTGFKSDDDRVVALYQAAGDITVAEWAARQVSAPADAPAGSSGYGPGYGYQVDTPWQPIVLPIITDALGGACDYDGPMHINVTPGAEQAVATLRGRWKALFDWGARVKLPQHREKIDRWDLFTCAWNYNPNPGDLIARSADLQLVEGDARELGYQAGQPELPPVQTPGWGEGTYTDKFGTAASTAVSNAVKAVESAVNNTFPTIPWAQLGLGAGALLVVGGVLAAWSKKPQVTVVSPPGGTRADAPQGKSL